MRETWEREKDRVVVVNACALVVAFAFFLHSCSSFFAPATRGTLGIPPGAERCFRANGVMVWTDGDCPNARLVADHVLGLLPSETPDINVVVVSDQIRCNGQWQPSCTDGWTIYVERTRIASGLDLAMADLYAARVTGKMPDPPAKTDYEALPGWN